MKEMLIGAVGIELKAMLKIRKLLIPLNEKNAKNTRFAEVRYTSGTRGLRGTGKNDDYAIYDLYFDRSKSHRNYSDTPEL